MKIAELFGKKPEKSENGSQLNDVLDAIIKLERKADAKKNHVEQAQKALQAAQAEALDTDGDVDISDQVNTVMAAKSELEGLEALLKDAKSRAIGLVAAGSASQRQRLAECEKEIDDARALIATRRIKLVAEFALKHGLRVNWPTKHTSGVVHIPAMAIEGDELKAIADAVVTAVHVDEDAANLDQLQAERMRLNVLIGSQPDIALESQLAERRRR